MDNSKIMEILIKDARQWAKFKDYPLSACVVKEGKIISLEHTAIKTEHDPTAHAEILAIREACKKMGSSTLEECWLFTTLEPCPMCVSACIWAKMKGIVFGATQEDAVKEHRRTGKWRQIEIKAREVIKHGTPRIELVEEVLREECKTLFDCMVF